MLVKRDKTTSVDAHTFMCGVSTIVQHTHTPRTTESRFTQLLDMSVATSVRNACADGGAQVMANIKPHVSVLLYMHQCYDDINDTHTCSNTNLTPGDLIASL
jgi:hypothetical protein